MMMQNNHTIAAIATGEGGAIAVIRVSGPDAITICDKIFLGVNGRELHSQEGYSLLYGTIEPTEGEILDDVLISVFRSPLSYTGENMVEISCHGSAYIKQEILRLLIEAGAKPAGPGEFTLRAFLNGKLDLAQAEAVADLIASDSRGAHDLAVYQMRGGYSDEFRALRGQLIDLAALLELELDFSEEDVEFADRRQIEELMDKLAARIGALKDSYAWGNVIKNGIPVAIIGSPNVGKSTLLNALLKEEKAMVSDIPGTTRDVIEDVMNIKGIQFRFIDTAGIRYTDDTLEMMGIERTFKRITNASVILFVAEVTQSAREIESQLKSIDWQPRQHTVILLNKLDKAEGSVQPLKKELEHVTGLPVFLISAKSGDNLDELTDHLYRLAGKAPEGSDVIVTNARHYEALSEAYTAIGRAKSALEARHTGDLLAEDVRDVIHQVGTVTGDTPTSEDVLQAIFSRHCIGK